jgi:hypothetical protein
MYICFRFFGHLPYWVSLLSHQRASSLPWQEWHPNMEGGPIWQSMWWVHFLECLAWPVLMSLSQTDVCTSAVIVDSIGNTLSTNSSYYNRWFLIHMCLPFLVTFHIWTSLVMSESWLAGSLTTTPHIQICQWKVAKLACKAICSFSTQFFCVLAFVQIVLTSQSVIISWVNN